MQLSELKPQFAMIIGGAGSGKNHFIESNPIYSKYRLVDVDVIKTTTDIGTAIMQIIPTLQSAFEQKENVVHTTMGINLKAQKKKIAMAREQGYNITLILIDTPADVAVGQVRDRVKKGGHEVSIDNIISSNKKSRENFAILSPLVDKSMIV